MYTIIKIIGFAVFVYIIKAENNSLDQNTTIQENLSEQTTEQYTTVNTVENITNVSDKVTCITSDSDTVIKVNCSNVGLSNIPENITTEVTILNLKSNFIKELSKNTFPTKLEKLKKLNLEDNKIEVIEKDVFENMPEIESLDLSKNFLKILHIDLFNTVSSLSDLKLDYNEIDISSTQLPNSSSIKKISLFNCSLQKLPENAFDGMQNLEEINLGGNPMIAEMINSEMLKNLSSLKKLIMPQNIASDDIINEICKSNGLLTICIEKCKYANRSCSLVKEKVEEIIPTTTVKVYDENVTAEHKITLFDDETITTQKTVNETTDLSDNLPIDVMRFAAHDKSSAKIDVPVENPPTVVEDEASDLQTNTVNLNKKLESSDTATSTSDATSNSGMSGSTIGILIAVIAIAIIGIIIKRNWDTIKRKLGSGDETPTVKNERVSTGPRTPEEVPLQSLKVDDNNVV